MHSCIHIKSTNLIVMELVFWTTLQEYEIVIIKLCRGQGVIPFWLYTKVLSQTETDKLLQVWYKSYLDAFYLSFSQSHFRNQLKCSCRHPNHRKVHGIIKIFLAPCLPNYFLFRFINRSILPTSRGLVWFLFYGPSTHFRSFRARSVNLATLFLDKPPRQFTST